MNKQNIELVYRAYLLTDRTRAKIQEEPNEMHRKLLLEALEIRKDLVKRLLLANAVWVK